MFDASGVGDMRALASVIGFPIGTVSGPSSACRVINRFCRAAKCAVGINKSCLFANFAFLPCIDIEAENVLPAKIAGKAGEFAPFTL